MSEITECLKVAIADRYLIEHELGQGGMATAYLAHDVKHGPNGEIPRKQSRRPR